MGIMRLVLYDCGMYVLKMLLTWDTILSCTIEELFLIIGYDNLLSTGVDPFNDCKAIVSYIFLYIHIVNGKLSNLLSIKYR